MQTSYEIIQSTPSQKNKLAVIGGPIALLRVVLLHQKEKKLTMVDLKNLKVFRGIGILVKFRKKFILCWFPKAGRFPGFPRLQNEVLLVILTFGW